MTDGPFPQFIPSSAGRLQPPWTVLAGNQYWPDANLVSYFEIPATNGARDEVQYVAAHFKADADPATGAIRTVAFTYASGGDLDISGGGRIMTSVTANGNLPWASNLVTGKTNGDYDVFVHDLRYRTHTPGWTWGQQYARALAEQPPGCFSPRSCPNPTAEP